MLVSTVSMASPAAADTGPEQGILLPQVVDASDVPVPVLSVGLSGATASATWADTDGIWTTNAATDAAPWTNTNPTPGFTADETDKAFTVAGDVTMATGGTPLVQYHLSWPGGSRTFQAENASLGHGGQYVQIYPKAASTMTVADAKSGSVVTYAASRGGVVDGTVLWVRSAGVLTGTDLVTNQTTNVTLPAGCAAVSSYDVRGRWASLACNDDQTLLDLHDPTHTVSVPFGTAARLGAGYVVRIVDLDSGVTDRAIVTSALTGVSRAYGPIRSRFHSGIALALNDDNATPQMAYADPNSQVRLVDLSWVNEVPPVTATGTPAIRGTARVGSTLTATAGAWDPADATVAYQWLANGTPIAGATAASLTLTAPNLGKHVAVRVTASKSLFASGSATSTALTILPGVIANSSAPKVRGILKTGRKLTAVPGTWTPGEITFSYQWLKDGRKIAGARGVRYKLGRRAKGHRFSVRITATKAGYATLGRTSPKTARIR